MLKQASVSDLVSGRVSRDDSYIVITMRRYPRFVNKKLRDEYLTCMSPERKLFEDWLSAKRRHQDHDGAFNRAHFEERFDIDEDGMAHLKRLSEMAKEKDVFLVCQCHTGKKCHREFLLIMAKELFRGKAEKPANEYPVFKERIAEMKEKLKKSKARRPRPPESTL